MPTTLECRRADEDVLHGVVRAGFVDLTARLDAADRHLPRHVVREVRRYLACGDPRAGFAWLVCPGCDHQRLVTFSCKGRGFCPRCAGRRMAERAARWVDTLFPYVAVRQWVLTVPWRRRWELARHPELIRGVLGVLQQELSAFYQARSGHPDGRTGAVTVVQRFGSALGLNVHLHSLVPDGVFFRDARTGKVRFARAPAPTTAEVEALVVRLAERCEAWLARHGFPGDDPDEEDALDDTLSLLQAASVQGRVASTGRRVRRVQLLGGRPFALPPRCAACDGYNLHGGVAIAAKDRPGLQRLCRYVLRPPLAQGRLEVLTDGTVRLQLKRAWSDGTTALHFSPGELVEKLVALVPPPHANGVLYHGVFAARSAWRAEVVPKRERPARTHPKLVRPDRRSPRSRWVAWSELLHRVFDVDGLVCPRCAQPMTLRAVVVGAPATWRVLDGLTAAAARAPPPLVQVA